MIGRLDPSQPRVTVVGAGVAGLLAAYRLDRMGWEVTLLEAAERGGGLIHTERLELGISERAAHSLLATPEVRELCRELGVELIEVRRESRARFIWRGGRPRKFPLRPWEALVAVARLFFARAPRDRSPGSLTMREWAERFLGRGPLEFLLNPFIRGVFGARPEELAVGMAFPALAVRPGRTLAGRLLELIRERRRRGEPRARMVAPALGMGALVEALERRVAERLGARYRRGAPVTSLPDAPNVILAVPAGRAAELLRPVDERTAEALAAIPYTPLVSVTLFVERTAFERAPQGVGVLVPERESGRACLGVLFNSSSFPGRCRDERAHVALTMMLGGSSRPELLRASEAELLALAETELGQLLGMRAGGIAASRIWRHEAAVPQYGAALAEAARLAGQGWCSRPGRMLAGNYTGQVSLRGMIGDALSLPASPPG